MKHTLETLEQEFPIGTIIDEEPVSQRFYCASEVVLEKIKKYHGEENVKQVSPHHVVATHIATTTIDGYLYDGENWYPVIRNGKQWQIYYPNENL